MSTTLRDRLKSRLRSARPVTVAGVQYHVRDLTVAELRETDRLAELLPEGPQREVRRVESHAMFALADADGAPLFPNGNTEDLDTVALFTLDELRQICEASIPSKDAAKNA
ncbi:hypothetical protein R5W23_000844 [Gemmata sp. JC673]|uniref:Uncharacterized protein n=1 Tax=Gemmata algarum TaxID=2975278 RepID=A0ABU5ES06_9BACT|nr:hypothetical protein [Gemmata algarum]MDY3558123.1 hypothetical protein [Gemmata algarum]